MMDMFLNADIAPSSCRGQGSSYGNFPMILPLCVVGDIMMMEVFLTAVVPWYSRKNDDGYVSQ